MGKIARRLGQPFMPWQQHVADIAGEVDPDTGLPAYREVVLLVPRQSGKTTFLLSAMVHRAFAFNYRPQNTRYAAQTGDDAIAKWTEHVELLKGTAFRRLFETIDVNGAKALVWQNKSRYTPTATTKRSGHGKTLDQGIIDEAFAQIDFRTEQAMRPAMITRRDAQLFVVSTAGDAQSVFLNAKIDSNRERLESDPDAPSRIAYFEWSADPDAEAADEEAWWECMPALGRTIHIDDIRAELEGMEGGEREFRRAYLNQTDKGHAHDPLVDPLEWSSTTVEESRIAGRYTFSLDISTDRSWSAVGIAGDNDRGDRHVGVARYDRGTHWPAEYLERKMRELGSDTVYVAARSQAALMTDELERRGLTVIAFNQIEVAAACAGIYDDIRTGHLSHRKQTYLDSAIAGAVWSSGETRTFSRGSSLADLAPLYAVTLARHGHVLAPEAYPDILSTIA